MTKEKRYTFTSPEGKIWTSISKKTYMQLKAIYGEHKSEDDMVQAFLKASDGEDIECKQTKTYDTPTKKDAKTYNITGSFNGLNVVYTYKNCRITNKFNSRNPETFKITINEILSVLEFYDVLKDLNSVTIQNYQQPNVQGFVQAEKIKGEIKYTDLTLKIPKLEFIKKRLGGKNMFECSLLVFLHEVGHLVGIEDEDGADKFAKTEFPKWKKIL